MANETLTVGTATGINNSTLNYVNTDISSFESTCTWRLPCGLCRYTNTMCPKVGGFTVTPTWTIKSDTMTAGTIDAETAEKFKVKGI